MLSFLLPAACGRREVGSGNWTVVRPDASAGAGFENAGDSKGTPTVPSNDAAPPPREGPDDAAAPSGPTVSAPDAAAPGARAETSPGLADPSDTFRDAASDGDARRCVDADRCD
jgi:hypothetical protein